MRWDDLFADLESQAAVAELDELDDEVAQNEAAEAAGTTLGARLRAHRAVRVTVGSRDGALHVGTVVDCTESWVLLAELRRRTLLPLAAVTWVEGLTGALVEASGIDSRVSLGHALRAVAEAEDEVTVALDGRCAVGVVTRVAKDHVDLRLEPSGTVLVVPFPALVSVAR